MKASFIPRVLTMFLILGILWLPIGCGGTALSFSGGPNQTARQERPAVQGAVARVNPVIFLDSSSSAPPGARLLAGALVSARGYNGDVLGFCFTNEQGEFFFPDLPNGLVTLEVREDPAAENPDATLDITSVFGADLRVAQTYPVSKDQARQIALQGVSPEALVAGSLNPIPAGTALHPAEEGTENDTVFLAEDSWLYYVDPSYPLGFAHDVEYRLVDARSGELRVISATFYPALNALPLWTRTELLDFGENLEPTPRRDVVQVPAAGLGLPPVSLPNFQAAPSGGQAIFAILVGGDFDNEIYKVATDNLRNFLQSRSVPSQNIRTILPSRALFNKQLKSLGGAEQGLSAAQKARVDAYDELKARYRELLERQIRASIAVFARTINQRYLDGDFSTLVYYSISHGSQASPGSLYYITNGFRALRLEGLGLFNTRACTVQVFIDACFSGPFVDELQNLVIPGKPVRASVDAMASAGADQGSGLGAVAAAIRTAATVDKKLEGLYDPSSQTRLSAAFLNAMAAEAPGQNPSGLVFPGSRLGCGSRFTVPQDQDLPPLEVEPLPARVTVKNSSSKTIRFRLKSTNQTINGGAEIVLKPGESFSQDLSGDVQGLVVEGFSAGGDAVADAATASNPASEIPEGTSLELEFAEINKACTMGQTRDLIFEQGKVPGPPRPPDPTMDQAPSPTPTSTPTPTPTPDPPLDLISTNPASLVVDHQVGVSPCPQLIGTIAIGRVASEDVRVTIVSESPFIEVEAPTQFDLTGPGIAATTRDVFFNCGTQNSFSAIVRVEASRTNSGASTPEEVIEIPVTVNISQ